MFFPKKNFRFPILILDTIKYINYRLEPDTREGVVYGTQSRKIIIYLWYKRIDGPNKGQFFTPQRKDQVMNEKIVAALKSHKTAVKVVAGVLIVGALGAVTFVAKSMLDKRAASQEVVS